MNWKGDVVPRAIWPGGKTASNNKIKEVKKMKASKVFVGVLVLSLLACLTGAASAADPRQASGGCVVGGGYDPNCDVDRSGLIDVVDIQLVAGHWGGEGTWSSDSWGLTGNAGTDPSTNFLGTTDGQDLIINPNGGGVGVGVGDPDGAGLAVSGGGMPMFLGSKGPENTYNTYLGFNVYHDGSDWIARGDTVHNGGALLTTCWVNGDLHFHTFDSTSGDDQTLSPNFRMTIRGDDGYVGIGTTDPTYGRLQVNQTSDNDDAGIAVLNSDGTRTIRLWADSANVSRIDSGNGGNGDLALNGAGSGKVGIGTDTPGAKLDVNGTSRTKVLQITGGSDLAEPFDIVGAENVEPGMAVVIDPENPGQLRIADEGYDRMVAGIVSGANGLNAGITMQQDGVTEGSFPVALSGRVYGLADASYGAIQPGDLLTTSDTPGHVRKVTDHEQAQGAIVGKAMSSLDEGQGLVLVLVSLQ